MPIKRMLDAPHPDAVALTAIRPVGIGLRTYTAVQPARGWQGIEHLLRTAHAVGRIGGPATKDSYAILDVLNAEADIIQDYGIPTAAAWRWWYNRLGLRVIDIQ